MIHRRSACCSEESEALTTRCSIEAIVTIDDRGQILLPKELRGKAKLRAGDKLVAIACIRGDEGCCITLVPTEKLVESVRRFLGPLLRELVETT